MDGEVADGKSRQIEGREGGERKKGRGGGGVRVKVRRGRPEKNWGD